MPKTTKKARKIVKAYRAYAVYGDYDGNAPTTEDLAVLPTRKEANALAKRAQAAHDSRDDTPENNETLEEVGSPYVDGYQRRLTFQVRSILVPAK